MKKINAELLSFPIWTQEKTGSNFIKMYCDWCFKVNGVEYWVPAGYVCDGASIPSLFWAIPGIGSRTDPINVAGAFAHDPLFESHALSFNASNEIARQLWIQAGKSEEAARIMWMAISSPAGKIAWHNGPSEIKQLKEDREIILNRNDNIDKFTTLWFVPDSDACSVLSAA